MKITMTVKAISINNAEEIAIQALYDFTKSVSFAANGNGHATHIKDDKYQVDASVEISCKADEKKLMEAMSAIWTSNPNIINGFVFFDSIAQTEHDKVEYYCSRCGCVLDDDKTEINPGTNYSYFLCNDCLAKDERSGKISWCDECQNYVSGLIENPVTHEKNLCPICGHVVS